MVGGQTTISATTETSITTQLASHHAPPTQSGDIRNNSNSNSNRNTSGNNNRTRGCDNNFNNIHNRGNRNNNNNNRGNYRRHQYYDNNGGSRNVDQQQRAGRYQSTEAARSFQAQFRQFDTGSKKFKEKLKATSSELIDFVNKDNKYTTNRQRNTGLAAAAVELARRESRAASLIHHQVAELLRTGKYGHAPRLKPDNCFCLMFENWNSLGVFTRKDKINQINDMSRQYEVDMIAGCETQADWRFAPEEQQFENLFGVGQNSRSVVGYNKTESLSRDQKGGTAMMALGRLSGFVLATGSDHTNLGRWSWVLVGSEQKKTRIVVAYQPCEPGRNAKGLTVFEQQKRYFEARGDFRSPRTIFAEQLIAQLRRWKADGEELVLCGDFNENVYTGRLAHLLASDSLRMSEQCLKTNGQPLPPTFVTGSRPIDAVYATAGVDSIHATILAKKAGVGDHRVFILDFTSESILGSVFPRVVKASARKLHCDSERIRDNYCKVLNELTNRHMMFRKLTDLHNLSRFTTASDFQLQMNRWDDELTQYMHAAENKCHTFKMDHIEYSPFVNKWLERRWILKWMRRYFQGKVPDPRNLFKRCNTHGLPDPRNTDLRTVEMDLFICEKQIEELQLKAPQYRREHLNNRRRLAIEKGDEKAAAAILKILHRESTRKRWRRVNYTTRQQQGGQVFSVQVEHDDGPILVDDEKGVFLNVSEHLSERFRKAFTAPSLSGPLFDDIGFLGDTEQVQQILEGTYVFPEGTDPATRLLLEEAAITYSKMSKEDIATYVTAEDFQYYWQRANERISSSYSGLHFGHYKAASFDYHLSSLHAFKLSICARSGVPLARWGRGLTVLLEKICGDNFVGNLRAICLFEADFNWWNKLIFARRMMQHSTEKNAIPEELFAKKLSTCDDANMTKTLFADVSKTLHIPGSVIGCDFGECYDRSAHTIQSIALQANGIPIESVKVLLICLQTMQFCLRTGFGESKEMYGGSTDSPTMGLGQGNGAAPPAWSVLSTLIVNAYKRLGHGAKLTSSYMARLFLLAAVMYVDDTDLLHLASSPETTDEELISQAQHQVIDWGMLVQATGGILKQKKCGAYFMAYKFVNGVAKMKKRSELPPPIAKVKMKDKSEAPAHILIPQPDGIAVPIATLDIDQSAEMLGVFFNPLGDGLDHITAMREKGYTWHDRLKTRPLPKCDAWMSFFFQLFPGISWGLVTVNVSPKTMDDHWQALYFKILPLLGVNRHIAREWRTLGERYHGLGLPDFVVVCFAAKVFFMQRHFGFESTVGQMLMQAYEAFLVDVGLHGNIFGYSFARFGCLATDGTWFKNFWEYASHLKIDITLHEKYLLHPSRAGDCSLMLAFDKAGYDHLELPRLNRFRHFKGVVDVSCVTCEDGVTIHPSALTNAPGITSKYIFAHERPTASDHALWVQALHHISSSTLKLPCKLGDYLSLGHQHHQWYATADRSELFFWPDRNVQSYQVFVKDTLNRTTRYGTKYSLSRALLGEPPQLEYASIRRVNNETVTLHSTAPVFVALPAPTSFLDTLHSFENQSLWRYFHCDGDGEWIADGLANGTLLIVHDGSYMRNVDKTVCSAAYMIYCVATKQKCKGSVVERSSSADNYRAEILGGLVVQLILRAATSGRRCNFQPVQIDCDNDGVVKHGNAPARALKEKQAQADMLRCLKQLVIEQPLVVNFHWVPSHQDDHKKWKDLTPLERINVIVDKLAKKSLLAAIQEQEFISSIFPFQHLRVELGGEIVTGSPRKAFERYWSHSAAQQLYHEKKIVGAAEFNLIWWDGAEKCMQGFPKTFRSFITKQTSKFCGTNRQLHRINETVRNVCPSCGQPDESSKHITRCTDPARVEMWKHSVNKLILWFSSSCHDLVLCDMLQEYLLSQGSKTMLDCLHVMSTRHQVLAEVHDKLGWDNFVEGRICTMYLDVIEDALPQFATPSSWGVKFLSQLVQTTHKQWLFRNSHVHYKKLEGLTNEQHMEIFSQVESLMLIDPADLLEKHQHLLLEEDFTKLGEGPTLQRKVWVASMETALSAAKHVKSGKRVLGNLECTNSSRVAHNSPRPHRGGSIIYQHNTNR